MQRRTLTLALLLLAGLAIPVLGIITTNERAHAFLVLYSAVGMLFNIGR